VAALRILTINTGKCDGPYTERIEWLAKELKTLQPDIIACQEAFRDEAGHFDTAGLLAERLQMHLAWSPARFKPRVCEGQEVESWSGMALLSRRPFTMVDTIELPSDEADGERLAQAGLLEVEDVFVTIANLHLTHLKENDALRAQQLRRVLAHPLMAMKRALRLVCGDFNSRSDGAVLVSSLGTHHYGHVEDAYVTGGGGAQRATLASGACVDFVLSLAEDEASHPTFASSAVVLNRPEPNSGILPSDHFGVATTMMTLRVRGWRNRNQVSLGV
jgi:endonuclease/exonuclease/phosphatase family metal-dependent hydrolase